MTMNKVLTKLRKYNIGNYKQLIFCVMFAVFLITSFAATLYSPTVQTVLPIGGDSRTQVLMIFSIALIGCLVFAIYAAGLFFKYKSKEFGVFLALGTPKSILAKALFVEVIKVLFSCIIAGVILGEFASIGIWQLFKMFLVDTEQMKYQLSPIGLGIGLVFGIAVSLCVLVMAAMFIKRSNLMDILNEQRKNEPIVEVKKGYKISGIILLIAGIFSGYVIPSIASNFFNKSLPSIWSVTYLLAIVGIYRLITYAISYHERGNNPQKYYKNIIPFSMMKSQGKQTVRNMLVIALLIGASLFALFYLPMNSQPLFTNMDNPIDFELSYKLSIDEVDEDDIYKLADKHNVEIVRYQEIIFTELIGSGVDRDWDDDGNLIEDYHEKFKFSQFISESEFNNATGLNIDVEDGSYYLIKLPNTAEGFWFKYGDLDKVTNYETNNTIDIKLAGTVELESLMNRHGNRYVLSDSDYGIISNGTTKSYKVKQILFNVEDLNGSYDFAKELYLEYLNRAPESMARVSTYDEYQDEVALLEGKEYSYSKPMELKSDNPDLMGYWKHYPNMRILVSKTFFQNQAIYLLLFAYVAIICLAAVGIIAYSRSVTIGINNKQLFNDLGKLGANHKYINKCIQSQMKKLFVLPTLIGSGMILGFMILIFSVNDGMFTKGEVFALGIDMIFFAVVSIYMAIIYFVSLRKIKSIVGI